MRYLALLLTVAAIPSFAGQKPCIHIAIIRYDGLPLSKEDSAWLQHKHRDVCPDLATTDATKYVFMIRDSYGTSSGTDSVHRTVTSTVREPYCPACPPIAEIQTPTKEDVSYSQALHYYSLDLFDAKEKTLLPKRIFSHTQVRQHGGDSRVAILYAMTERHPVQGLLKDALKFINKPH